MYDYNKPLGINDFNFISENDTGKSKILRFMYDGEYYEHRYNYTTSYAFSFITHYPNEYCFNHPMNTTGEKTVYSSTMPKDNTDLGKFIEYSLMKIGFPLIRSTINSIKTQTP